MNYFIELDVDKYLFVFCRWVLLLLCWYRYICVLCVFGSCGLVLVVWLFVFNYGVVFLMYWFFFLGVLWFCEDFYVCNLWVYININVIDFFVIDIIKVIGFILFFIINILNIYLCMWYFSIKYNMIICF